MSDRCVDSAASSLGDVDVRARVASGSSMLSFVVVSSDNGVDRAASNLSDTDVQATAALDHSRYSSKRRHGIVRYVAS